MNMRICLVGDSISAMFAYSIDIFRSHIFAMWTYDTYLDIFIVCAGDVSRTWVETDILDNGTQVHSHALGSPWWI